MSEDWDLSKEENWVESTVNLTQDNEFTAHAPVKTL